MTDSALPLMCIGANSSTTAPSGRCARALADQHATDRRLGLEPGGEVDAVADDVEV